RELVDEGDVAGRLEALHASTAVLDHLAFGQLAAGLDLHEGHRHLGEPGIGHAHDSGHLDGGMAHEETLHLHGVDVLPADLQHVLVAAEEPQVAIGAHDPHVASVKPAVLVEGPSRILGPLVVALRHHVAPSEDLPRYECRLVQPCRGIDDTHLAAGEGIAVGLYALLFGRVEIGQGHDADLAHPEAGHEVAERLASSARDWNGARHARAADNRAHARDIARVLVLGLEQILE